MAQSEYFYPVLLVTQTMDCCMKKITLILAVLLCATTTKAALPTTAPDYFVKAPIFNGGYEFGITALLLKSSTSDLDFATIFPGTDTLVGGTIKFDRPSYDFGYQVNFGY